MSVRALSFEEFNEITSSKRINDLQKELKTYVTCLNGNPSTMLDKTLICANPWALSHAEVGEENAEENVAWWINQETKEAIGKWFFARNHKISNGDGKNWICGNLGSRWIDVKLNGKRCRVAYYTAENAPIPVREGKKYVLMFDPTN